MKILKFLLAFFFKEEYEELLKGIRDEDLH